MAGFADDDLEQIAEICSLWTYRTGEHCATQGMPSDEILIVKDGKVAVEMHIDVAPYAQILRIATLTTGNIVDFSAFLEPHSPTASAICIEKAEIICIKLVNLEDIFKQRPPIEHKLMKNLVAIMGSRFRDSRIQLARFVAEIVKQGK